jgi:hypothetical protein
MKNTHSAAYFSVSDLLEKNSKPTERFSFKTFQAAVLLKEVLPMKPISKERLAHLRKQYTAGARVQLLWMDDVQAPPAGTKGTVWGVDDTGSIMVQWDNGSSLNVIYGIDSCKVIEENSRKESQQ